MLRNILEKPSAELPINYVELGVNPVRWASRSRLATIVCKLTVLNKRSVVCTKIYLFKGDSNVFVICFCCMCKSNGEGL